MDYVIKLLTSEHQTLVEKIISGEHNKMNEKIEIENAILWLKKIMELQFGSTKLYRFVTLPNNKTDFSEYRIFDDCDSDNIKNWIELKDDEGVQITLVGGDIVIRSK